MDGEPYQNYEMLVCSHWSSEMLFIELIVCMIVQLLHSQGFQKMILPINPYKQKLDD